MSSSSTATTSRGRATGSRTFTAPAYGYSPIACDNRCSHGIDAVHHPARRGHPQRHARRGHRGACRPRQDHAGRRHAAPVRCLPQGPGRGRARHGLDGPRARARHHHPGQADRHRLPRHPAQHRGHARSRRFRGRGRAQPAHGRLGAAAGGRRRGAAAPDTLRAGQGHGAAPAGHRGHQQDRPWRRPCGRGGGPGLRALHGPRRR